jgi:hypothetical protein
MALTLDKTQRDALVATITAELPNLNVLHGSLIDAGGSHLGERVRECLPKAPKVGKTTPLTALPDDVPMGFFLDQLEAALPGPLSGAPDKIAITSLSGLTDAKAVAERLVESFISLPWQYSLMLPTKIAAPASSAMRKIDLGNGFFIQAFSSKEAEALPIQRNEAMINSVMHRRVPERIVPDQYYFVQMTTGYITKYQSVATEVFVDAAKGFFGLCSITGLLRLDPSWLGGPAWATPVLVYRHEGGQFRDQPYQWLSVDDSDLLGRLVASGGDDAAIACAVSCNAFRDSTTRSAARWHLDSFAGSNELLQIIQATVSLEILVGDKEESEQIGLAALLANRLAYFIGDTPTERVATLKRFKQLYKVRSEIVHRGKAVLAPQERKALHEIRIFAHRAIGEQVLQLWKEAAPGGGGLPKLPLSG